MQDLLQTMLSNYEDIKTGVDPQIDNWLFMKSPIAVVSILAFYLYFVLKLGPQFMEKRKPFEIQGILIGYNAYQVLFSTWLCSQAFKVDALHRLLIFNCKSSEPLDKALTIALWTSAWWYFFSKIVELLDTVFFVLRKKQNQVTFLHVYHHTITALFSWGYLKYLPGEQGALIGFLNSFVHIIMYFYYMVAAMGPKYKKYIWWKKYMTWLQLAQFGIMLVYLLFITFFNCKMHKSLTFFFVGNVVIFIYLFSDFYRKSYIKNKQNAELNAQAINMKTASEQTQPKSFEKTMKIH